MLSINKLGSDKAYEFVFDAKYKIDTSTEYQKSYGGIGPKEEIITVLSICLCGFISLIASLLKMIYLEMNFN
ncbi:hypothetical protein E4V42_07470 [Clostridium estertheticum]|uniref:Uncharacterized protein n=1 Tax=Clostridium estertheticum TaxID=238834 RepID=A0A5N7IZS4_9CLOT|nr:hypothetical protein [Clostridium estertheticum]MPQ31274.1 hypothetical protein [Clostridium estertheticum]MPQ61948.1 hypothetical protein [Clostridium estertheticum]